MESYPYPVKEG